MLHDLLTPGWTFLSHVHVSAPWRNVCDAGVSGAGLLTPSVGRKLNQQVAYHTCH